MSYIIKVMYAYFWTISLASEFYILCTYQPMKLEQTECSETSAYKIQTPGNYPEENIQHSEHGESLKSRKVTLSPYSPWSQTGSGGITPLILDLGTWWMRVVCFPPWTFYSWWYRLLYPLSTKLAPRGGLNGLEKREIVYFFRESNPHFSVVQAVVWSLERLHCPNSSPWS